MSEEKGKELPKGWSWVSLGDVGQWAGGGTPSKGNPAFWKNGNLPWVSPKDMKCFEIFSAEDRITEEALTESSTTKLPPHTVLMVTRSGILRHSFPVAVARVPVALNQDLKAVTPHTGINSGYVARTLCAYGQRIIHSCVKDGTTVQSIETSLLKGFLIPLAPENEQTRIADKLDELLSDLDAGVAALAGVRAKLKDYRAAVLKAAVEGALTADLPCRQAGWRDPKFRNCSGSRVPENSDAFFAYVLECEDGSLYKGFCQNLWARIDRHLDGRGAEWTSKHKPVALVHFEKFDTMAEAREREVYFKSGSGREWLAALWKERKPATESAADLLTRILAERRRRWEEAQLQKFKEQGKAPPKNWPACRTGRKAKYQEPAAPDTTHLPGLPEGWRWVNLDQLKLFSLYGPRFSSEDYSSDGVCVLRTSDISDSGKVDLVNTPRLNLSEKEYQEYALQQWDVLFTRTGSIGRLSVFDDNVRSIAGAYLIQYRLAIPGDLSWWVFRYFQSPGGLGFLLRRTAGVGRPNLNAPNIESIPIPLPPSNEIAAILEAVEDQLSVIDHLEADLDAQLKNAQALRQSILRSAFEGRLVPQDPNDEPASELLKRIAAEREARAKAANPKKPKSSTRTKNRPS